MSNLFQKVKRRIGPKIIRVLIGKRSPRPFSVPNKRIVVAGLFNTASGIGESARLCFEGLKQTGYKVEALDVSWVFNMGDFEYENAHATALKNPGSGGTLILHLNGPETLSGLWRIGFRRWHKNWKVIGYWAWELPIPPPGWKTSARFLDEIWVPSRFVKESLEPIVSIPIKIVPHAVGLTAIDERPRNTQLQCLTMADGLSSFERKNIVGALEAYIRAFPVETETKLIVKCRNLEANSSFLKIVDKIIFGRDDIELVTEVLDAEALESLFATSDVLISLHRAEGFGLTIAEIMQAGNIAICTAWSGNMEFVSKDSACLIDYDLIKVNDPYNVYNSQNDAVWADPHIDQAAEFLKDIYHRRAAYDPLRDKARQAIKSKLSPENYGKALIN